MGLCIVIANKNTALNPGKILFIRQVRERHERHPAGDDLATHFDDSAKFHEQADSGQARRGPEEVVGDALQAPEAAQGCFNLLASGT